MTPTIGTVIAGAGVVGLAVARALAQSGQDVLVLETEAAPGTVTSARNSEVIHAGLYYRPGSLRARLCLEGRRRLYEYCASRGVAAPAVGKLLVATDAAEEEALAALHARARANGVTELRPLTAAAARAMEPALACTAALFSPVTGIVDSHALMLALRADAEAAGAVFAFRTPVVSVEAAQGFTVRTGGADPFALHARAFVNCAGLAAPTLAARTVGLDPAFVPRTYYAKGSYFALGSGRAPFRHLIYPVPIPGGAGIHLTLDRAGRARFGPDVEPVSRVDYAVDPARAALFDASIRRYWPGLPDGALVPDYAGIRPKIVPPTEEQDFRIDGPETHGIPGLVNLFGIESPGLTACLAIADEVCGRLPA